MASSLVFTVRRSEPELVGPAEPTPRELKLLSDIDDQEGLRFQIPVIQFYKADVAEARDPVGVIRDAVAKALVFYYPFAGRLRELTGRKLAVDCTAEGLLFIAAEADVALSDFGPALQPPFPCFEELLFDVPGSGGITASPLLLIQVTRLKCGGFIFALRLNHTMSDAQGLVQFMSAVADIARGAHKPSLLPTWQRDLLNARDPPHVSHLHHEYNPHVQRHNGDQTDPFTQMAHLSFFFGKTEIAAIRRQLPPLLQNSASAFDLLTACLWRCRTRALEWDTYEEVRVICIASARSKFNSRLPEGYYGNVFAFSTAVAVGGELCGRPLEYAVELVREAKVAVTEEYMRSVADMMVLTGRPHFVVARVFLVSDLVRAGFGDVDFGWGRPVYGGAAKSGVGAVPGLSSFYIPADGGIVVPLCLPALAMDKFVDELKRVLEGIEDVDVDFKNFLKSSL